MTVHHMGRDSLAAGIRLGGCGLTLAAAMALAGCFETTSGGAPLPRGALTIHSAIQDAQDRGDYASEALLQAELGCKTSGDCAEYERLWRQSQGHKPRPESGSRGGGGGGGGGGHAH